MGCECDVWDIDSTPPPRLTGEIMEEYEEKASPLAAMLVCAIYGFCIGLIIGVII